jgi:hypothetical protein
VRLAVIALAVVGSATLGCSGPGPIVVDLRTDFVPIRELVRVETTLSSDSTSVSVRHASHEVSSSADYLAGVRVAELDGVPNGSYRLDVSLLDAHAAIVATRRVEVTVTGRLAVTVVMTRNCRGVRCPPDADPDLTECVDDRCVDPRCTPTTPALCPAPDCTRDADCTVTGCGRASCAGGTCLVAPNDGECGAGRICTTSFTCVAADVDAGAIDVDAGGGTGGEICTNGVDDDGDTLVDCADGDCAGAGCDDGNACTASDRCVGTSCAGDGVACTSDACNTRTCNGTSGCATSFAIFGTACADDGNPCTADVCDGRGNCAHAPTGDGTVCGTPDHHCCSGVCVDVTADATNCGACGVHCVAGHPCIRIPTTNFGTCGCTAPYDSACAGYGPGAWCSPGGRCQCTCGCPTSGPCDMTCSGACGSGTATCRDINGMDNWCSY